MKRRDVLKTALAGATALAAPRIVQAEGAKTITFTPHADLASLDPVWTTADITRNFSLAVYDTLYGYNADFEVQPQMVEGHVVANDGKQWDLTLRDGLAFHDGTAVLARDCVATIQRCGKRYPFVETLMSHTDELTAVSDKVIRFRLKKPFALLPNALAEIYCAIMPERLAKTDPMAQVSEAMGSGPFKYLAAERISGQRVVYAKNDKYVPRKDGKPSFNAGPKVVYVDRVVWNFIPDPATASAALTQGEIDWWENPTIDLVPQLKRNKDITLVVKDRTGEIGCLRFNHLFPPFDNAAIRRVVVAAMDQKEIMEAVAGAEPSLIKTDVGIFVPGTPMASTVGVEVTRGPKDYEKLKRDLDRRRLQGREGRHPRGLHDSDHLGRGAGCLRHAEEDRHEYRLPVPGMGHRGRAACQPGADRQGRVEHLLHVSRRLRKHLAGAEHHLQEQRYQEQLVRLADRREDGGTARRLVRRGRRGGTEGALRGNAGRVLEEPALCASGHVRSADGVP